MSTIADSEAVLGVWPMLSVWLMAARPATLPATAAPVLVRFALPALVTSEAAGLAATSSRAPDRNAPTACQPPFQPEIPAIAQQDLRVAQREIDPFRCDTERARKTRRSRPSPLTSSATTGSHSRTSHPSPPVALFHAEPRRQ